MSFLYNFFGIYKNILYIRGMLNKTNTKMENVNYKREEAYLYNKKEKADKKRVEKFRRDNKRKK